MADNTDPLDKRALAAEKIKAAAQAANDLLGESNDLAKSMVGHFSKLVELRKTESKYAANIRDFSKVVLRDTRMRRDIVEAMLVDINDAEKSLSVQQMLANDIDGSRQRLRTQILEKEKEIAEIEAQRAAGASGLESIYRKLSTELEELQKINNSSVQFAEKELEKRKAILKQVKSEAGYIAHVKDVSSQVLGIFGSMGQKIMSLYNTAKTVPIPFLILDALLTSGVDRFKDLDKAAENFRKNTGFTIDQMRDLRKVVEQINMDFQEMGIGPAEAYSAAKSLVAVYGRLSLVSKDALTTTSLLAANLGVATDDTAKTLSIFQGLGGVSEKVALNIIAATSGLAEGAGVSFSMVMRDVANASDQTLSLLGAAPTKLMLAALSARILGSDLNKLAGYQRRMLDYTSSITDELSASALLGQSISFQRARQLAYEGDIVGATRETLNVVKSLGDFNGMSVYQREAIAKATGIELTELTKMLAVEKQRDAILYGSDLEAAKRLRLQEAELKTLGEKLDAEKQDLTAQNEKLIRQQKIQGLLTRLTNLGEELLITFGDALEPIITPLVTILIPILKLGLSIIKGLLWSIAAAGKGLGKMVEWVTELKYGAESVGSIFNGWMNSIKNVFSVSKDESMSLMEKIATGVGATGLFLKLFFGTSGVGFVLGKIKLAFELTRSNMGSLLEKISLRKGYAAPIGPQLPKLPPAPKSGGMFSKLSGGIGKLGSKEMLKAAGVIAILAGSLVVFSFALKSFTGIEWDSVGKAGIALGVLSVGAAALGLIFPIALKGALVLGALGLAMIPFGLAAMAAGYGIKLFGEGIASSSAAILQLSNIDMTKTAIGITALGAALATFGGGQAASGLGSFVGNLLGGNIVDKLEGLASVGERLKVTASAITDIGQSMSQFANVTQFSSAVDVLTESLKKLNDQLEDLSLMKLAAITAARVVSPTSTPAAQESVSTAGMESRLDELIKLLKAGAIAVNMDGKKVSSMVAVSGT